MGINPFAKKGEYMTKETIKIIRSALNTLRNLHDYISCNSKKPEVKQRALKGYKRVDNAIAEFEAFVIRHVLCGADR